MTTKIVLVTGAGTGIGRATARTFAAHGAHVIAVGRRVEPLRETAADDERITPFAADITATGGPEHLVDAVRERYGRLDVLVNNAGIVIGGVLGDLAEETIAAVARPAPTPQAQLLIG